MRLIELVVVVLGPILTATVAGIGVLINEWRNQRRWEVRQRLILERGLQEVTFIAQWGQAHDSFAADDPDHDIRVARAITDLERTYRDVEESLRSARAEQPDRWDLPSFARFLLLGGLRRPWARVVRVFYFLGLVLALLVSVGTLAADFDGAWGVAIVVMAVLTAVYLLPVWGLHRWARWLDRPSATTVSHPAPARQSGGVWAADVEGWASQVSAPTASTGATAEDVRTT